MSETRIRAAGMGSRATRNETQARRRQRAHFGRVGRMGLAVLVLLALILVFDDHQDHGGTVRRGAADAAGIVQTDPVIETPIRSAAPAAPPERPLSASREPGGAKVSDVPRDATEPRPAIGKRETPPPVVERTTQLTLEPSANGNYYVKGWINGAEVLFLLDTGASWISIPDRLRWKLGLERGRYVRVSTAAGVVGNYATRIDRLEVGPFRFSDVAAALNPYAPNDIALLGMSALKDIQFTQSRGQLVLSQQGPAAVQAEPISAASVAPPLVIRRSVRECIGPGGVVDTASLRCIEGR